MDDIDRPLRGPQPANLRPGHYLTCMGAAQTFGCFAERPFGRLISDTLNIDVLNLGIGGAGPSLFQTSGFLNRANQGKAVIVQVMSGRSISNSLFDSNLRRNLTRHSDGVTLPAGQMYKELLEGKDYRPISKILHETRDRWVEETANLLSQVKVPTVLLWLSTRAPEYSASFDRVGKFFGAFPQLVNREMIELVRPFCDCYVECVGAEGLPQPLRNRFSGEITGFETSAGVTKNSNEYYPSPEMHRAAAAKLLKEAGDILR